MHTNCYNYISCIILYWQPIKKKNVSVEMPGPGQTAKAAPVGLPMM